MFLLTSILLLSHLIVGFIFGLINLRRSNESIFPFESKFELVITFTLMGYVTLFALIIIYFADRIDKEVG
jgi:uncharacterized membrane protein YqjE